MTKLVKKLPAFGFLIAVVLVCVTSAFKNVQRQWNGQSMLTFQYTPPDPLNPSYAPADVSNLSNWSTTSDPSECSNDNEKACKIYVPDAAPYVDGNDNLQPAINLTLGGTTTEAFVQSTDLGDVNDPGVISNKQ